MQTLTTLAAEQEARELAASILAGETQPYGKFGIYTAREWIAAAQYLTDTDDCDELVYMMEHEAACEDGVSEDRWADEADYRYEQWRDAQLDRDAA